MAKENEKKLAREFYIQQNKSENEIATKLNISLRTVQRWAKEGNWKKLRDSKANAPKQRIERTQMVVDSMVEERLAILKELKELQELKEMSDPEDTETLQTLNDNIASLRKQAAAIDDAISKWNKRIENLDKETKITLSTYMEVMDRIFEALRLVNEPLYMQSLDFQENHLEDVSSKML